MADLKTIFASAGAAVLVVVGAKLIPDKPATKEPSVIAASGKVADTVAAEITNADPASKEHTFDRVWIQSGGEWVLTWQQQSPNGPFVPSAAVLASLDKQAADAGKDIVRIVRVDTEKDGVVTQDAGRSYEGTLPAKGLTVAELMPPPPEPKPEEPTKPGEKPGEGEAVGVGP